MWLSQFVSPKDGAPRWALQREQGGAYEVIRRRSARSFAQLCEVLMAGDLEKLALKREVEQLPGALLVPTQATKVICVGLNYRRHAEEMNKAIPQEPLIFMKPTTALLPHGGEVELPPESEEVHHEGELAMVIGRVAKRIGEADAMAHVLGYTCANDVTARDIQRREMRYTRGKGFDTFCPLGPALRLASSWEPGAAMLRCEVNGEVRQQSEVDDMIFGLEKVVSFVSSVMTLMPGDVILTGTPSGVGKIVAGDGVDVRIEGVGRLSNKVVSMSL